MHFDNPLDPIYKAYTVAIDCFNITMQLIDDRHGGLTDCISFKGASSEELVLAIDNAEKQTAELAILALFATFERYVIEYLQTANRLLAAGFPKQYATRLARKFTTEVEYWRFGEILDLFKGEIDANLIGEVKQVKQYRDWIAHRNPGNTMSTPIAPDAAFTILSRMIQQIRFTHTLSAEERLTSIAELAPAL